MNGNEWKKNLWDYLAMALGFWILKDSKGKAEKFGVVAVVVLTVILMVFT